MRVELAGREGLAFVEDATILKVDEGDLEGASGWGVTDDGKARSAAVCSGGLKVGREPLLVGAHGAVVFAVEKS